VIIVSDDSVGALMRRAYVDGAISKEGMKKATASIPDLGAKIEQGIGRVELHDQPVLLVTALVDDTASIEQVGKAREMVKCHNRLVSDLSAEGRSESILLSTRYLSGKVLNDFRHLADVRQMSNTNYTATCLETPLYRETLLSLMTILAQTAYLESRGCEVTTITLIASDGHNNTGTMTADQVAWVVRDMSSTGRHLVTGLGISTDVEFKSVFAAMGIDPKWILISADLISAILKFKRAAQKASLGKTEFQELLLGSGF
jgi:hypothetical protein